MINRQMLLSLEPKLSAQFQAQIKNAYGTLADEVNRKAEKPRTIALLGLTVSNPPTQAEMQAVADKVDALVTALQA